MQEAEIAGRMSELQRTNLVGELVGRYVADLLGVDDWRSNEVAVVLEGVAELARGASPADVRALSALFPTEIDDSRADRAEPLTERELVAMRSLCAPHMRRVLATIGELRSELIHTQATVESLRESADRGD